MLGSHATLMGCVSDSLVRNMHTSSQLEVILLGSGSAPPVPPRTKKQIAPAAVLMPFYFSGQLEIVLGDTANLLVTARTNVPSWSSWPSCAT